MAESNISIYNGIGQISNGKKISIELFFDCIQNGKWQDIVLPIRTIEDKKLRDAAKKKAPVVTLSGLFNERTDIGLEKHSTYIGIDVDDVSNPEKLKQQLCSDKYTAAAFTSISGRGLCLVFNINPGKHREAFQGISEYLYKTYDVICDPTSINVSRPRFVSFDPAIFRSVNYDKFVQYPKDKPPKKIEKVIYAKDDFNDVLKEIMNRRLNLVENYHDWLRVGFALAHKFGEQGREYYHLVSQFSSKYQASSTDKQFTACLKHSGRNEATISTFFYYCKGAGIPLYSERTKIIAHTASHGKKGGLSPQQVAQNLEKFEDITDADDIIRQVWDNDIEIGGDNEIDELELWLRQNYELRRNSITRYIENKGKIIEQKDFNTIFIAAKKIFDKLSFELMDRLINSDFVASYNPLLEFFERHKEEQSTGHIETLFSAIEGKDAEFLLHFGRKWLVGIISSIHGEHSPLMLILTGAIQNTGKTEFFRRLLPDELKSFYAESKLDAGKDDEILMTQKLIIMDDEMGGKSKKENKRLKELTSKQTFSLREPYGRNNVDLVRLAVLGGTSNDNGLLNDPTGNRRIIPGEVYSVDFDKLNSVNRVALFMEAYWLWKDGFVWKLNKHDIDYLGQDKLSFEMENLEKELLQKYFEPGDDDYMTASEIKIYIEDKTRQKLLLGMLGRELKSLGFQQKHIDSGKRRAYCVTKKIKEEQLPF